MKTVNLSDKKALEDKSGLESVKMGMSATGLVHLMGVLTNLYSNAHTAVLREVVSNGIDSHIKAGQSKAVDVTLPTWNNRNLVVRDYGVGMNKQEIIDIYSQYGASTKRDSNDELGGFGLGAKSPLAIAERFDVFSIKDGVRIDFYVEKDALGAPSIYFVSETETDEPTGVQVTVPYDNRFDLIQNADEVSKLFIGMPKSSVKFNGAFPLHNLFNTEAYQALGGIVDGEPASWISKVVDRNGYGSDGIYANIGGIRYHIDVENISNGEVSYYDIRNYRSAIYLNIPIGTVDLTPSREALIYSPRTVESLTSAFNQFRADLTAHYNSMLNKAKKEHDAIKVYHEIESTGYWDVDSLRWRSQEVQRSFKLTAPALLVTPPSERYGRPTKASFDFVKTGYSYNYTNTFSQGKALIIRQDVASHELQDLGAKLRRYSRTVKEELNIEQIFVVGDKDYENKWYSFAHHAEYKTAEDLINMAKAVQSAERKAAREANKGKTVKRKKVAAYLYEINTDLSAIVRKAFVGDEVVEEMVEAGTVYYLEQNGTGRGVYPYHNLTLTSDEDECVSSPAGRDTYGFKRIIRDALGDTPLFLVSSRSNIEKFTKDFPGAKDAMEVVKAYAKKHFAPVHAYTWHDIRRAITDNGGDWGVQSRCENLLHLYKHLEEKGRLHEVMSADFAEIQAWVDLRAGKQSVGQDNLTDEERKHQNEYAYWVGYSATSDTELQKKLGEEANRIQGLAEKWFLVASSPIHELKGERLDDAIAYLNMKP